MAEAAPPTTPFIMEISRMSAVIPIQILPAILAQAVPQHLIRVPETGSGLSSQTITQKKVPTERTAAALKDPKPQAPAAAIIPRTSPTRVEGVSDLRPGPALSSTKKKMEITSHN